jgi:hypothetical protein
MAYSTTIPLVEGDTLPILYMNLKDSNEAAVGQTLDSTNPATWAPIDLTGCTVRLKVRAVGSTELKATIVGSVTDAVNGRVAFQWTTSALDTAGTYEAEVEVTDATNNVQTVFDLIKLKVRADF